MNILVVGGAGYLGGAFTDLLMKSEHDILVYDILLYEETYRKQVPFVYGDIRDRVKLKPYLEWADAVIWLAALVGDLACSLNRSLTKELNTESVQYLRDNFKGRIIYMSTCSLYGAADTLLNEQSPLKPLSLYAETKLLSEKILVDTDALIFRLGTLYGVSDAFSRIRFDLVVNTLTMHAMFHGRITVFGGEQYRPLIHVRDAAKTICANLSGKASGIYNVHSGNFTIIEIASLVKEYFPNVRLETADAMFQDNRNYRVTCQKAQNSLDFKPQLSIGDGIKELKALFNEGRVKNSFLSRFSNYLYLKPLLAEYSSPLGNVKKLNI